MINIDEEIKEALLNKEHTRVEVLRALKNEMLKFKTQKNAPEYTDVEEIQLIKRLINSHIESIEAFKNAGRDDLIKKEKEELSILKEYMPEQVSLNIIEYKFEEYLKLNPNTTKKDMGKIIKYLKESFPANDGKDIANIVKKGL